MILASFHDKRLKMGSQLWKRLRNIIGKAQKSQLPSKYAPKKKEFFVASEHPEAFELFIQSWLGSLEKKMNGYKSQLQGCQVTYY